jgi:hypothetical protein
LQIFQFFKINPSFLPPEQFSSSLHSKTSHNSPAISLHQTNFDAEEKLFSWWLKKYCWGFQFNVKPLYIEIRNFNRKQTWIEFSFYPTFSLSTYILMHIRMYVVNMWIFTIIEIKVLFMKWIQKDFFKMRKKLKIVFRAYSWWDVMLRW